MKVVFLLDTNEYIEVAPELLQLRQLGPGQAALGISVIMPTKNEDGSDKLNEDGSPETQTVYRPLINYTVDLTVPQPQAVTPVVEGTEAETKKKKSAKKVK